MTTSTTTISKYAIEFADAAEPQSVGLVEGGGRFVGRFFWLMMDGREGEGIVNLGVVGGFLRGHDGGVFVLLRGWMDFGLVVGPLRILMVDGGGCWRLWKYGGGSLWDS